jgi:polysaccharide biosynthesis/export protein
MKPINTCAHLLLCKRFYVAFFILMTLASTLTSCVNYKKAVYFNNLTEGIIKSSSTGSPSLIQNNDILSISVSSLNPEASAIFNTPNNSTTTPAAAAGSAGTMQSSGYLVKSDGSIQFPILGEIKAAGLTKEQLELIIKETLVNKKLLIDPIVTIRYLNFRVTVLGEVARPSVINVPSEKISLLEAIGLAGDLTIYAKRDNVLLIREEAGQKITKRLNLNSSELFTSSYYYLKSNDVIYVEPGKAKVETSGRGVLFTPIIISSLTLAIIVIDRVLSKN